MIAATAFIVLISIHSSFDLELKSDDCYNDYNKLQTTSNRKEERHE